MLNELKGYLDVGWKTKDECLRWLKGISNIDISERGFRQFVADFNKKYESGEQEMFIAHSNKGYLLTSDPKTIMNSLIDDYKRSMKMLKRYYRCKKAISDKNQLALEPQDADMYNLISRIEI